MRLLLLFRLDYNAPLSGRYTVRCNLADIVIRVSSYNDTDTCRHMLPVTRTGANEYALMHCIRTYSDKCRNNFVHAQTMASAILFESRTTILVTVQYIWQCIPWVYIDSTKEFHVRRYENISKQDGCIYVHCLHASRLAFVVVLGEGRSDVYCALIG